MKIHSRDLRTNKYIKERIQKFYDLTVHVTRSEPTVITITLFPSNIGGCVGLTMGVLPRSAKLQLYLADII